MKSKFLKNLGISLREFVNEVPGPLQNQVSKVVHQRLQHEASQEANTLAREPPQIYIRQQGVDNETGASKP